MKKYKAAIDVFDTDYRIFVNTEILEVDSKEEALEYISSVNGRGEFYILKYLQCNKTREIQYM